MIFLMINTNVAVKFILKSTLFHILVVLWNRDIHFSG